MTSPWLTLPEFMTASGWSRSNIFRLQAEQKIATRKDGRATLYSSASLPASALATLETLGTAKQEIVRPSEPVSAPAPLFATAPAEGPGRRIVLSAEQERQAEGRLAAIQPLFDFLSDATFRARCSALRLKDGSAVRTADHMAQYLAELHSTPSRSISRSSIWLWKQKFESDGLPGLARKVRDDKGRSKWAARFPQAAEVVTAAILQSHATRQRAYDSLTRDAARLGMTPLDVPSYAAVCDFIAALPAAPVVLAREGDRAHDERFASYLRRDYFDIQPFQVVVSDHMIHDCEVWNDCFLGVPDGAPMRLRLTMLMDLRSRKALGCTWTPEGSSRSISSALRSMVQDFGVPKIFYCDNGKDYQKVGRGAAPANGGFKRPEGLDAMVAEDMAAIERTGVLRQLGIQVQYCIKYHPQSKPIERMFRTLHLGLDAILPHYLTGSTTTRPEAANEAGAAHRKLLRMDRLQNSPLLRASEFIAMAKHWIEHNYNDGHVVRGRGMSGLTPNQVFDAGYPAEGRRTVDQTVLDQLLWQREKRQVRNCAVTVNNRRLIGATRYDQEVMYRVSRVGDDGTDVIVCFDPNSPGEGVITDMDGRKLCSVVAEQYAPHSAEAGPMIREEIVARRTRRNDSAASIRALQKRVIRAGHQTDASLLYDAAVLPIAVNEHITQRVVPPTPKRIAAPRYAHEVAADMLREG
jgi:hypothetical protein